METRAPREARVGLIANPMSGRDVRRVAARASRQTLELKREQIQRAVIGAAAAGAERLLLVRDCFRSARSAVESLRLHAAIEFLDIPIETQPADTPRTTEALRKAGCGALVVMGGDGTHRLVARAWRDAALVAVSTGTNNVFPELVEATSAGAAAGLVACGAIPVKDVAPRCKVVEARFEDGSIDLAVVDAALLENDHPGSLLPFDPAQLRHLVLTRAEPAAVGMSPIGGLLHPTGKQDDRGVEVRCAAPEDGGRSLLVPVSPGLYRHAHIASSRSLPLGETIVMRGPGVIAFDGDRQRRLEPGEEVELRVVRTGPFVIDVNRALATAAECGIFLERTHWHDGLEDVRFDCC